ncbi:MAG: hypothetical protein EBQ76_00205 [Betaproteobacteria bacterium]|nr:hypothetical protein [Betaproteobacteria bacterium]
MAAHGLTIMRQVWTVLREQPHRAESFAAGALEAPGTCFTAGFSMDAWSAIDSTLIAVSRGTATLDTLREVVQKAIGTHLWMEAYPTLEAVRAAKEAYVKVGTPHFRKRMAAFDAGDKAVHAKARRMVEHTYPLTHIHAALLRDWSDRSVAA